MCIRDSYKPTNYDGRFRGIISMRTAIQYSVNVPAVKFMQKIGVATGYDMAEQLGISLAGEQDMNLALALGGMTYGTVSYTHLFRCTVWKKAIRAIGLM